MANANDLAGGLKGMIGNLDQMSKGLESFKNEIKGNISDDEFKKVEAMIKDHDIAGQVNSVKSKMNEVIKKRSEFIPNN